jgi:hypothetical protein
MFVRLQLSLEEVTPGPNLTVISASLNLFRYVSRELPSPSILMFGTIENLLEFADKPTVRGSSKVIVP